MNHYQKYCRAKKRWKKAINQYFKETGILINQDNILDTLFENDPTRQYFLKYKSELPKYLTSANSNLEENEDQYICWKDHHRNRKQRKRDYLIRLHQLEDEHLDKEEFEKEKRDLWFLWLKK